MDFSFEKEKNIKAASITVVITAILFLIFFYVHYSKPVPPEPITGEGIEVNLGNSETGFGTIAPQSLGKEASQKQVSAARSANNATQPITNTANPSEEDIAVNNNKKSTANTNSLTKPLPTPTPKAVFKGATTPTSTNKGGNNSDSYNGALNQGIAGGKGDQGKPNGNPNSDSYNGNAASGNSGSGGVAIKNGLDGRRITKFPNFEDDFNENAKVAVDITVDQMGNIIAATINPKGTTTTNTTIRNIAVKKARTLKLNSGPAEAQRGTLIFSFILRS